MKGPRSTARPFWALLLAAASPSFLPYGNAQAAAAAKAENAAATAPSSDAKAEDATASLGHQGQFDLRADFVTGYRMLFRYDQSPPCSPWNTAKIDLRPAEVLRGGDALSPGDCVGVLVVDFFEPFVFGRFGLSNESKTNSGAPVVLGAGARLYTMSEDRFKIFFSPWAAVDLTSGPASNGADFAPYRSTAADYKTDFLLHIDAGPQFEFSRYIGVYASGGLTFGMLRYLSTNAELALGVELRAP